MHDNETIITTKKNNDQLLFNDSITYNILNLKECEEDHDLCTPINFL